MACNDDYFAGDGCTTKRRDVREYIYVEETAC